MLLLASYAVLNLCKMLMVYLPVGGAGLVGGGKGGDRLQ